MLLLINNFTMKLSALFSLFLSVYFAGGDARISDWRHFNQQWPPVSKYPTKTGRVQPECYNADGLPGKCVDFTPRTDWVHLQKHYELKFILDSLCLSSKLKWCRSQEPQKPILPNSCISLTAFPPDPRTQCCGIEGRLPTDRIAGGVPTTIQKYPWLAVLNYRTRFMCAGTLISSKYVLTAAHCLTKIIPYSITLGEYDLSKSFDCDELENCADLPVQINIEKRIIHPDFRPTLTQMFNDIGLVRLQHAAPYTGFIRPICLPNKNDNVLNTPEKLRLFVAGWGQTNKRRSFSTIKNHAKLHYVDGEECSRSYLNLYGMKISSYQICAAGYNVTDACLGDSGAPLMYKERESGQFRLIGVVSFGQRSCGKFDIPGVYTKVSVYNTWIRRNMEP